MPALKVGNLSKNLTVIELAAYELAIRTDSGTEN